MLSHQEIEWMTGKQLESILNDYDYTVEQSMSGYYRLICNRTDQSLVYDDPAAEDAYDYDMIIGFLFERAQEWEQQHPVYIIASYNDGDFDGYLNDSRTFRPYEYEAEVFDSEEDAEDYINWIRDKYPNTDFEVQLRDVF